MKLFSERSSHWYTRQGVPCHTVTSRTGEPRPTTVRDARKMDLLPSVTNVLGVVAKPELIDWKMEQAVLAALTLPRKPGEGLDLFARRVVSDSQCLVQRAADFGSSFHAAADRIAHQGDIDPAEAITPWVAQYRDWFRAHVVRVLWSEQVLVNNHLGYAGTADLLIEHQAHGLMLVDIKTQIVKPGAKARVYPSWRYQLSAYRAALGRPVRCMNLIVNSSIPEPPAEHLWTDDQILYGEHAFRAAHYLWCEEKAYWPGAPRVLAA